jgi:hypothetical protein
MEFIQSTVMYSTLLVVLGWLSLYLPGLLLLCAILAALILLTQPSNKE